MPKVPERVSEQRQEVVNKIIEDMQTKGLQWSRDWACVCSPQNPISGTVYQGGNRLHLSLMAAIRGYDDPRWVTFNQAKNAGWKLKEGSKSCIVEKWKAFTIKNDQNSEDLSDDEEHLDRTFLRCVGYWSVFNASQFENAPAYESPLRETTLDEIGAIADDYIASSRCKVDESLTDTACYYPGRDFVQMPLRNQFISNEAFIRTLWHEMTHSTMHPGTGASRVASGRFGSPDYAFEELIAELGSVFVAGDMNLSVASDENSHHYQQHVAYLQSWIKALGDDPSYVFKAAATAEKAADYLTGNYRSYLEVKAKEKTPELSREQVKEVQPASLSDRAKGVKEASTELRDTSKLPCHDIFPR